MEAQLQEFLHDKNPNVRQIALENLLGQTPAGSPYRNIFFKGLKNGSGISNGTTSKDTDISRDLKLLCRDQLHPPSILADLAAMLLSNLTSQQSVCSTLLSLKIPIIIDQSLSYGFYPTQSRSGTSETPSLLTSGIKEVVALPLLLDAFSTSAKVEGSGSTASLSTRKGELHFLSSVFANLSLTPNGRLFFLTPISVDLLGPNTNSKQVEYPISKVISFTEHKDTIRRGGVAAVIKNCCFHAQAHKALLSLEDTEVSVPPSTVKAPGVNILPAILLPLTGPEELDLEDQEKLPAILQFMPSTKRRESDGLVRLTHVESLLLLCTTRWGREFLRSNGTYEIVRVMYETEPIEKISEHVERLVNLLKRDESEETLKTDDEIEKSQEEEDSEDERITEV
ncbi:hypothetical protein Clacol_005679 [Clathrus columnatus]|uniref:Protein HGH1 homolog n=1 Tax=Clathrus columnatus TaxID=1419009 RepID=A0AAV5AA01_9AGAM|nr:hypothetical protein Clacol_005679 [Clathrus columnatus]